MSRDELVEFWVPCTIFAMIGIGFVLLAREQRRKVEHLRRVGRRTSAVVVDYEYRRDKDGAQIPYPLVRFQLPGGRLVTARTDFGGSFVPAIGEHVDVLYDPDRPEKVHNDSRLSNQVITVFSWFGWVMIAGAAGTAAVILVLLWPLAGLVGVVLAGAILAVVVVVRQGRARRQPLAPVGEVGSGGQGTVPAGWLADPRRRHQLRYWDGQKWTEHVFDGGIQAVDPL